MLLEALRNQETTGSAATGGTIPYDDYGLQGTIGGLGGIDPNANPYEDWALSGLGDTYNPSGQPYGSNAIGQDGMYLPAPRPQPYHPLQTGGPYGAPLSQLQQGLVHRQQASPPVTTPSTGEEPVNKKAQPVAKKPVKGGDAAHQILQSAHQQYAGPTPQQPQRYIPRVPQQQQYIPRQSTGHPANVQHYVPQNPQPQPVRQFSAPVSQPRQMVSAAPTRTAAQTSLANAMNALAKYRR